MNEIALLISFCIVQYIAVLIMLGIGNIKSKKELLRFCIPMGFYVIWIYRMIKEITNIIKKLD